MVVIDTVGWEAGSILSSNGFVRAVFVFIAAANHGSAELDQRSPVMTESSPEEDQRTVGEIIDDTDRTESRCSGSLNGIWMLTVLFAILAVAGWLMFEVYFSS
jgi:hypothetical protein